MWRNKRMLREKPYLMMCFFYTGGFIIAFSAILNLGILARQRVQMLPMFLALLVALSWDKAKTTDEAEAARLNRREPRRPPERKPPAITPAEFVDEEIPAETATPTSRSRSPQAPESSATGPSSGRHRQQ